MAKATKDSSKSKKNYHDDEFDPLQLIETSINSGFDPSVISAIDERDLPWAPNVAAWLIEPEYLGIQTVFPLQLQVLLKLFGDVCPWCSDWEFYQKDFPVDMKVGNILDKITLLIDGKCPKCGKTKLDQYHDHYWQAPHELDLLWGMRSGKSAVAGMLGSYVLHRFLRIHNPAQYFGLLRGSLLVMRFVALTAGQAEETIWGQFYRAVDQSAWFPTYHDFLKQHEKSLGLELKKWLATVFHYPAKGIYGYYVGASIDSSRGRTAFFTGFDEIGWWLGGAQAKRANAEETYAAYEKASRTVRNASMTRFLAGDYNIPTAYLAAVSSTSSKSDYIMRLIRSSKTDKKKVGSHKASWEVNPEFFNNPDALKDERENNPKIFMRDYGSVPPFSNDPFIDNEETVYKNIKLDVPQWPIMVEEGNVGLYLNADNVEKNVKIPYCLALDLAHNHCGYAAALLKLKESDFSTIQVAGLWSIYPLNGKVIDLHQTFEQFVKKLCERLPIKLVVYDQWQSKSQIQALKGLDLLAKDYSLIYKDFEAFRNQLTQGKIELCKPEIPIDKVESSLETIEEVLYPRSYLHFLWQILSVSEIGNKVTKGEGHDDLFRAVVLGSTFLWNDDWRPIFEYKGGVINNARRASKGRLVMAGGSMSGQMYNIASTGGGGANVVSGSNKRAIGAIIPRSSGGGSSGGQR